MKNETKWKGALWPWVLLLAACGGEETPPYSAEELAAVNDTYASLVWATYGDARIGAQALEVAIDALLAAPSEDTLAGARDAWRAAREPYLLSEAFRFYDGPIDDPELGVEGWLNAWPLDEQYLDYVEGEPGAGIVNDPSIEISRVALLEANEDGGDKNVATGYHAIEFLLWGQDLNPDGPGARPHTDYVETTTNADRRRSYLKISAEILVEHLTGLEAAWAPEEDNYRRTFVAQEELEAVRRMLTGLIVLSGFETGGERLQAALDSGEQEDEHSCFSDNTHRDMIQDVVGVQNVWRGRYTRLDESEVSGPGVRLMVEKYDAELVVRVDDQIAESLRLANALEVPFDREIREDNAEGRLRVRALIDSLQKQEALFTEVFSALGLAQSTPVVP